MNRFLIVLNIVFFLILWSSGVRGADYCSTPPFLTTTVSPNILLAIDVSGSMSWSAYFNNWQCNIPSYNSAESYEGYFIPEKHYKKMGDIWKETTDPLNCDLKGQVYYTSWRACYVLFHPSGVCSGNQLNFALMTRIDLLRWAFTGGRPKDCDDIDDPNCDPILNTSCRGDTCTLETYLGDLVEVPSSRIKGVIQEIEKQNPRPRFGALFYSSGIKEEKIYMGDYPYTGSGQPKEADSDHPYTHLIRFLNYINPHGGTATGPAMWEAYDYFAQADRHTYANGFDIAPGTYKDPNYFCDAEKDNCQAVPCAKNFVILASDGQWNGGGNPLDSTCSIDSGYEDYSADPVVPAYRMHHDVLRTLNGGNIRVQQVYALGLFLGGTGEQSLKNLALYGSFDLSHGDWPANLTGYPQETCKMDDCCDEENCGKGSACTPLPSSSPDWDRDGDGQPDTFLKASTATQIKDYLLRFFRSILAKTSSGTSVSVLTARGLKGSSMVQAVFYPKKLFGDKELSWLGYLYDYWLYNSFSVSNIREDTIENKALDVCSSSLAEGGDYILDFKIDNATGDLTIDAYKSTCNGAPTSKATTYHSLDDLHTIWEAGDKLASTNATKRTIYTSANQNNIFPSSPSSLSQLKDIDFSNATYRRMLGDENGDGTIDDGNETVRLLSFSTGISINNLIEYIYGKDLEGYRSRKTDTGAVWKLGDIIYSTPQIVQYSRKNTSSHSAYSVVYVGANDGMLHAFLMGQPRFDGLGANQEVRLCKNSSNPCDTDALGQELWSFVPKNVLPYLRFLTDPDYCHLYYVDLQPYIFQVDDNKDGTSEKIILIGGMRLGGAVGCNGDNCIRPPEDTCADPDTSSCIGLSSYFALDITDPENPKFLWEFTDPDLGFTYSGPAVITYNGTHYIMFLSGPTNYEGAAGNDLRAFVLKLRDDFTVESVYKLPDDYPSGSGKSFFANYHNAFGGRLFTNGIDYNKDGNTDMVVFGINQWAGSTAASGGTWQGNVAGVLTNSGNPLDWEFITIFTSAIEPITAKIEYMECFGHHFIFFGTGRWFYKTDEPGQNVQDAEKLYGVMIDGCFSEDPSSNCMINPAHGFDSTCDDLYSGTRVPSWRIELAPKDNVYFKERLITDPTPTGMDIILFTTFQPTADVCGYGGRTRLWAMNCATGASIGDTSCPGYTINQVGGTIHLQLSRGNIEEYQLSSESFTKESNKASNWETGVPPESPTQFLRPLETPTGEIIYWIEK